MKSTLRLTVDVEDVGSAASQASLRRAAAILQGGGTVAFPTETVYGLGANALDATAVNRVFEAKQRPSWDPLIVHVADEETLQKVALAPSEADLRLMKRFWPGALTLLLSKQDGVPANVTAGRTKVGVRMPRHVVALELLRLTQLPVAAPSANSFSKISPTTAMHVLEDLDGRIDAVIDGGPTDLGLESTVIDANTIPPMIYRPGMLSIEQLRVYLPDVTQYLPGPAERTPQAHPSPGVGLRHYAPRAELILVPLEEFGSAIDAAGLQPMLTGVLLPAGLEEKPPSSLRVFKWGRWSDPESLARDLYAGLRELDLRGVQRILCPLPEGEGLGAALRDRLYKAAKPREMIP